MDIVSLKINSPELCILHCLPRVRLWQLKRDQRPPCPCGTWCSQICLSPHSSGFFCFFFLFFFLQWREETGNWIRKLSQTSRQDRMARLGAESRNADGGFISICFSGCSPISLSLFIFQWLAPGHTRQAPHPHQPQSPDSWPSSAPDASGQKASNQGGSLPLLWHSPCPDLWTSV